MPRSLKYLALVGILCVLGSCAWEYAGRDGNVPAEKETAPHSRPAHAEQPEQVSKGGDHAAGTARQSSCTVHAFTIERFTPESRVEKQIDCASGEVVQTKRVPMTSTQLQQARAAGLPEDTWYVLVDPSGLRTRFLDNDALVQLAERFELRFLGKDGERDLIIYEYADRIE